MAIVWPEVCSGPSAIGLGLGFLPLACWVQLGATCNFFSNFTNLPTVIQISEFIRNLRFLRQFKKIRKLTFIKNNILGYNFFLLFLIIKPSSLLLKRISKENTNMTLGIKLVLFFKLWSCTKAELPNLLM